MTLSPSNPELCLPFMKAFSSGDEILTQLSQCTSTNPTTSTTNIIDSSGGLTSVLVECSMFEPTSSSSRNDTPLQMSCLSDNAILYASEDYSHHPTAIQVLRQSGNCSFTLNLIAPKIQSDDDYPSIYLSCETNVTFLTEEVRIEGSNGLTFWTYFILRVVATMFMTSCFSLLDATTLAIVKKADKAEYGKERIWSVMGFGLTSPLAGLLVDQVTRSRGYTDGRTDFSSAFYVSNVLLALNILTYMFMTLHVEKPEKGIGKYVQHS
jgi:hypothetical protein